MPGTVNRNCSLYVNKSRLNKMSNVKLKNKFNRRETKLTEPQTVIFNTTEVVLRILVE
jgi:hypothetical protein